MVPIQKITSLFMKKKNNEQHNLDNEQIFRNLYTLLQKTYDDSEPQLPSVEIFYGK